MDEKKAQNDRARRGQAAVRVQIPQEPVDNSPFGLGARANEEIRRVANRTINGAIEGASRAPVIGPAVTAVRALSQQPVRVATRDFYDGLAGNPKGGKKVPVQRDPVFGPVESALAQGRAAPAGGGVAPANAQNQLISAILGSGLTVNEAGAVTGILPAPGKAPGAKDVVMSQAAQLSEALFQNQVNQATELAKTDPEGARAEIAKATAAHFNRQAGLVGFNPVQLAQAALINGAEEGQ